MTHPAVLEVAVIGARRRWLDQTKSLCGAQSGQDANADSLSAHVKRHLAPYEAPRWIEFAQELPKTATGKIQRFKLRQLG